MRVFSLLTLFLLAGPLMAHVPQYEGMTFLTQEEKTQLRTLHVQMERIRIPLMGELRLARLDLQEALLNGAPEQEVREKFDRVQKIRASLRWNRLQEQLRARKLLGEEKYTRFRTFLRQRRHERRPLLRKKKGYPERRFQ